MTKTEVTKIDEKKLPQLSFYCIDFLVMYMLIQQKSAKFIIYGVLMCKCVVFFFKKLHFLLMTFLSNEYLF